MTNLLTETDKIPMERIIDLIDSLQNLSTTLESQVLLLNGKINQNTQAISQNSSDIAENSQAISANTQAITSNTQAIAANTQLINTLDKPGDICYSLRSEKQGWLLCNGQAVSRTIYSELFATIGTTYGQGDGSTTFNVPDYRGKFLQMVSGSQTVGEELEAGLPNITGRFGVDDMIISNGAYSGCFYNYNSSYNYDASSTGGNGGYIGFRASRSSSIYGKSSTVQPPAFTVNYFIKY